MSNQEKTISYQEPLSYQEKNIAVSLGNFLLILTFFTFRIVQMVLRGSFEAPNVFRLWGIIIILSIAVTIFATIITHIVFAIVQAVKTQEEPVIEGIQDERDKLIDLRGTRVTYIASSIGVLLSMLTFVFGQPPLVMFTLLILAGVAAQIIGDIYRLRLYRRGF